MKAFQMIINILKLFITFELSKQYYFFILNCKSTIIFHPLYKIKFNSKSLRINPNSYLKNYITCMKYIIEVYGGENSN